MGWWIYRYRVRRYLTHFLKGSSQVDAVDAVDATPSGRHATPRHATPSGQNGQPVANGSPLRFKAK
jgi:hypothetical protein